MGAFPELEDWLTHLPPLIGRDDLTGVCERAATTPAEARHAFVSCMIWGFGKVGYGPWRTRRILSDSLDPDERLRATAATLQEAGALGAYRQLATTHRLRWLGPAFGTKFLFFCPRPRVGYTALILDRLVTTWLSTHCSIDLNPVLWNQSTYERYLFIIHEWAQSIRVRAEEIEQCMFRAQAAVEGNQWAMSTVMQEPPEPEGALQPRLPHH
jgi:hypothetical protein